MPKVHFVLVCCRHSCVTSCSIHASRRPCGRLFVLVLKTKDTALPVVVQARAPAEDDHQHGPHDGAGHVCAGGGTERLAKPPCTVTTKSWPWAPTSPCGPISGPETDTVMGEHSNGYMQCKQPSVGGAPHQARGSVLTRAQCGCSYEQFQIIEEWFPAFCRRPQFLRRIECRYHCVEVVRCPAQI